VNRAKGVALLVVDLEHAGGAGVDHGLEDGGQIEMFQLAAKVAAAVRSEVGDSSFETPRQALQVVEGEISRGVELAEQYRARPLERGSSFGKVSHGVERGAGEDLGLGQGRSRTEVCNRLHPDLLALDPADLDHTVKHQIESCWHLAGLEEDTPGRLHVDAAESRERHLLVGGHAVEERAVPDRPDEVLKKHRKFVSHIAVMCSIRDHARRPLPQNTP
jgi:hypothetical protein